MSNGNDKSEQPLEGNVARLLSLHQPDACMPADVKERIASILMGGAEATGPPSGGPRSPTSISLRRPVARIAAAVAAAAVAIPIGLWLLWPQRTIAWVDVASRVRASHTMRATFLEETRAPTAGGQDWRPSKRGQLFEKDPGLQRVEQHSPPGKPATTSQPRTDLPSTIWILKNDANAHVSIHLEPGPQRASRHTFLRDASVDHLPMLVTELRKNLGTIVADQTRTIGPQEADGATRIGFEAPLADLLPWAPPGGTARIWVDERTATPIRIELAYPDDAGRRTRQTLTQIEWDVPLPDALFDLPDLQGWEFNDAVVTSLDFSHDALRSGLRFRVRTQDGQTVLTEDDVAAVPRGRRITTLTDGQQTVEMLISLRLTQEGQDALETMSAAHVGEKLILDFGGQAQQEMVVLQPLRSLVPMDVSGLAQTLEEFEARYLAAPDAQRDP